MVGAGHALDGGLGLAGEAALQTRPEPPESLEALLRGQRKLAEALGEWAFYAAVVLLALALIGVFRITCSAKCTLMALAYLVLACPA